MERIGLFSEMAYVTVGDKYVSQFNRKYVCFSLQLNIGHFLYESLDLIFKLNDIFNGPYFKAVVMKLNKLVKFQYS